VVADLDQPVKALAVDQGLQVGANQHIGRRLAGLLIADHANRMIGTGAGEFPDIGFKGQNLITPCPGNLEVDSDKGGVVHDDANFLDGRDETIIVTVLATDGRKETDQHLPAHWSAEIPPGSVPRDSHVQIAAERRIPQMHRRGPLPLRRRSPGSRGHGAGIRFHGLSSLHDACDSPFVHEHLSESQYTKSDWQATPPAPHAG